MCITFTIIQYNLTTNCNLETMNLNNDEPHEYFFKKPFIEKKIKRTRKQHQCKNGEHFSMSDCLKKQFTTKWLQLVVVWLQILHKIQSDFWPILEKMLASHLVKHKIIIFSPLSFYILFIFFIGNGASYIFIIYFLAIVWLC